jgi:protein-tyrosine phosphatase
MTERRLDWEGCLNVRDLGGHPTEDGGETRMGAIVRADSVRQLTEAGWAALVD